MESHKIKKERNEFHVKQNKENTTSSFKMTLHSSKTPHASKR